jgi:hypothetical protein
MQKYFDEQRLSGTFGNGTNQF